MKSFFLNSLEKAVNAYLLQDEQSSVYLKKLAGKTLGIELLPMQLAFNCSFSDTRLQITMGDEIVVHTKIKGTPLQLSAALFHTTQRKQFFAEDLKIEGDAELAQDVIHLFDQVQIDWEEHLARLIGDVPAVQLTKAVNSFKQWLTQSSSDFTQDINDYLHEEAACVPPRAELQTFFSDIDTLRMDTDRLEARIHLLKSQLAKEGNL